MAQTMNMTTTEKEHSSFDIAEITGAVTNEMMSALIDPQSVYTLMSRGAQTFISTPDWSERIWSDRIRLIQGALALFNCLPAMADIQLRWLFSGKTVNRGQSVEVMDRWLGEGMPPVMDLISFDAEDKDNGRWMRTNGLYAIVGYEIETFIDRLSSKELPRAVGYLAQELLCSGPVSSNEVLGPDGTEYLLERVPRSIAALPKMRLSLVIQPERT